MPKRKHYASYDPRIKAAIASTGRVDLFPELKIPRTNDPILETMASAIDGVREDLDLMRAELIEKSRFNLYPISS